MEFFKTDDKYQFLKHGKLLFGVSLLFILASITLVAVKGINFGIDFVGGTVIQVQYKAESAPIDKIREALEKSEMFRGAMVSEFGAKNEILIKSTGSMESIGSDVGDMAQNILKDTGEFEIRRVDMVGPKVGDELKEKGLTALILALVVIMIYVAFRYEWRFALASVLALVHDIVITIGAISLYGFDVNLEVLAALLTILGYSINDTVIVFDRIRERVVESKESDFKAIIDESVSATLSRTILTSLTVFFVVLTLYLFGGEIILGFSFPLLIGVIVGTYSSIFIAAQMAMWLGFSVSGYRKNLAEIARRKAEKDRLRAQYERGMV